MKGKTLTSTIYLSVFAVVTMALTYVRVCCTDW